MKIKTINSALTILLTLLLVACNSSDGDPEYVMPNIDQAIQYGRLESSYVPPDLMYECALSTTACIDSNDDFTNALTEETIDTIILRSGSYDLGLVRLNRKIEIKSETLWGAVITGSSFFYIEEDDIKIEGVKFIEGASPTGDAEQVNVRHGVLRVVNSNDFVLSNNYFESIGINTTTNDGTGLTLLLINANDTLISNNVFTSSWGIAIKTDDVSTGLKVLNNDFLDSSFFGGAGEVVHLGDATSIAQGTPPLPDSTYAEVAFNFVNNWSLERELISIKSSNNHIHNNKFVDNSYSAIVIRMGNENLVENNLMRGNTEYPLRISGERNSIRNNVMCGQGATVSLHAERVYVEPTEDLYNAYWAAVDNEIVDNFFYGYTKIMNYNEFGFPGRPHTFVSPPVNNRFVGNILYGYPESTQEELIGLTQTGSVFYSENILCPFI